MNSDESKPKVGHSAPGEPGIRLFAPPPSGFDPTAASDSELQEYGFPVRPDAHIFPQLHVVWRQTMSEQMLMIQPQFDVVPYWFRKQPAEVVPTEAVVAPTGGDGWCGSAEDFLVSGDAVTVVMGAWTVPNVYGPYGQLTRCGCAEWLGIDGYNELSVDIVQAGTTQTIVPLSGHRESFAWFEWYPAEPKTISNFPVSPGDYIFCIIDVRSPAEVGVFMNNTTSRLTTSFVKEVPKVDPYPLEDLQVHGVSVEWVLENPESGWLGPLPKFGRVFFDTCLAGTRDGRVILGGKTRHLLGMHDVNGETIARSGALADQTVTMMYARYN
jgi:hypothetical protein